MPTPDLSAATRFELEHEETVKAMLKAASGHDCGDGGCRQARKALPLLMKLISDERADAYHLGLLQGETQERARCIAIADDQRHVTGDHFASLVIRDRIQSGDVVPPACRCGHNQSQHEKIRDPEAEPVPKDFWLCRGCERAGKKYPETHHEYRAAAVRLSTEKET